MMNVGDIHVARSFWQRFIGLMFRKQPPSYGLLFPATTSIHMFFMRFPIDVVVVDRKGRVTEVRTRIKPWRIAFFRRPGWAVLEVADGTGPQWAEQIAAHPETMAPLLTS